MNETSLGASYGFVIDDAMTDVPVTELKYKTSDFFTNIRSVLDEIPMVT